MERLYTKARREKRAMFYRSKHWAKLSKYQKSKHPFCAHCAEEGVLKIAKIADHKDCSWQTTKDFLNPDGLQSLCKFHHDLKTRFEDIPKMRRDELTQVRITDG